MLLYLQIIEQPASILVYPGQKKATLYADSVAQAIKN
jgi:hypothetical protein